jgi:hypothetical protein
MSMTFFQYNDSLISVSSSIWIYFLIAILLTVVILGGIVYLLRRRRTGKAGNDEESREKQVEGPHSEIKQD